MRNALMVYLAIEDYYRPKEIRLLEFLLASTTTHLGFSIASTLGIGQISEATFVSAQDVVTSSTDAKRNWIASAANDCESVAILQAYARKKEIACKEQGFGCALYLSCFWHTGRRDSCLHRYEDRQYAENVALSYSRIAPSNQVNVR